MGKAIQVFLILNLLLGAAMLGLGLSVFQDRGVIKARALLLEQNAAALAKSLAWAETVAWEEERTQLNGFRVPQPTVAVRKEGFNQVDLGELQDKLRDLETFATTRVAQLTQRYSELVQTRQTLVETTDRLGVRTRELAAARQQIGDLEQKVASTHNELREANRNIDTLRTDNRGLTGRVEEVNGEITALNDKIAGDEVSLEKLIQEINNMIDRYEQCRVGAAGGRKGALLGQTAKVLSINPDWNFIVISKGAVDKVEPRTEGWVHRGKDYIGKVTVLRVEEKVSVAEVNTLVDGTHLMPGDTLFF